MRLKGKRVRTAHLEVRYIASLLRSAPSVRRYPRAGVIVPKYSHNSVERNLVKRRLREIVRQDMLPLLALLQPVDVVVRALPSAYRASFADLRVQCRRAFERAGLVPGHAIPVADATGAANGIANGDVG